MKTNKLENENYFTCYSQRMAIYLREHDHDIVKTAVNRRFPQFDVYYFERSQELEKDINYYLANCV